MILRSFVSGYFLSTPDIALWGALRGNRIAAAAIKKGALINLTRWYKFVEELCPWATSAVQTLNAAAREKKLAKSKEGGSYDIALEVCIGVNQFMNIIANRGILKEHREWRRYQISPRAFVCCLGDCTWLC